MAQGVKVIVWRDVIVLSDDGRGVPEDYDELLAIAAELMARYPNGIGLLVLIPENAVPPSDKARAAMNRNLADAEKSLRGASWCIEGSGFQAAMARAVLTGIRFLTPSGYSRHVSSSMAESLTWLLHQLNPTGARAGEVDEAVEYIRSRRDSLRALEARHSPSGR
jgi:hypothetical protein